MRWNRICLPLLLLGLFGLDWVEAGQSSPPLVVISMRQYLVEGSSRIHLYLYSFDGTFRKALTNDSRFNDLDPVFSRDGRHILFKRKAADKTHTAKAGNYIVDLESGAIRMMKPKEDSFPLATDQMEGFSAALLAGSGGWIKVDATSFHSPDGRFTIVSKENPPDPSMPDFPAGHYFSVVAKDKPPVRILGLPGFVAEDGTNGFESFYFVDESPFFTGGDMDVIFVRHHLNSTDGESIWGLDLTTMRGEMISPNAAKIYHPPAVPGVFAVAEARYLPLNSKGMTVDCKYLEWWNAHLKKVRYGPILSVCYSASIYFWDHKSMVIRAN